MKTISNTMLIRYITYIDCDCNQKKAGRKLGVSASIIGKTLDRIERFSTLKISRMIGKTKAEPTYEMLVFYEQAKECLRIQLDMMGGVV